jgi:hypothetical protein
MDNDQLMKELEELTKDLEKEMNAPEHATQQIDNKPPVSNNLQNNNQNNIPKPFDFNIHMNGNEEQYLNELEKMLNMNLNAEDSSDPQAKQAMKALSISK